ncbi:MAG: hypothetical protein MUF30_00300 [Burkholderiales bacterium]|jgi:hypothetical protein|nr:hypothetical protein [Burkholderiales bacterium]
MTVRIRHAARVLAVGAALCTLSAGARADDDVFEGKLRPCLSDGTAIGGVNACGKRWKLESGEVDLDRDGDIEVEIKGLVLDDATTGEFNGTADGVTQVVVSLVCGGTGKAMVVAESERFALTRDGTASFETKLRMPAACIAPVVLVREVWENKVGGWLAVTGF